MKKIKITAITVLAALIFTACSDTASDRNINGGGIITESTPNESKTDKNDENGSETAFEAPAETEIEPAQTDEPEYNFTPVLTEDDIEYMGIPYKDLTAEQFIQLWAQCTRECNVQRLYVLSFGNYDYDEIDSEEKEKRSEEDVKEAMEQLLHLELIGRMLFGYYDVELHELEDAPEGYYDNAENKDGELHYLITYKSIMYENGSVFAEGNEERWITLKKVDGYWRIGVQFASSPYFFDGGPAAEESFEDIGEAYYREVSEEDIVFDEEHGVKYARNQLLISVSPDTAREKIDVIVTEVNAEIVGFIELTGDYQIEFTDDKTLDELSETADYIMAYPFVMNVTLNIIGEIGCAQNN